jgi:pilus assembly protein Flp/PilA
VKKMTKLYCWLASTVKSEEGAALAEYGLLVALIAVVCIGAITLLGGNISAAFNSIAGSI